MAAVQFQAWTPAQANGDKGLKSRHHPHRFQPAFWKPIPRRATAMEQVPDPHRKRRNTGLRGYNPIAVVPRPPLPRDGNPRPSSRMGSAATFTSCPCAPGCNSLNSVESFGWPRYPQPRDGNPQPSSRMGAVAIPSHIGRSGFTRPGIPASLGSWGVYVISRVP